MPHYRIRLRETRLATDGTDDVALFDVTEQESGQTWLVPAFLSPLFRLLRMAPGAPDESRREMVSGLGARAIAVRLRQGVRPPLQEPLVFTTDYPGAPGDPDPLLSYEQVGVCVEEEHAE